MARADFTGGALRERVNIKGVALAEKRNKRNDCPLYRRVLFEYIPKKIRDLKEWVRGDVNGDYAEIEEYSVKVEEERVKEFIAEGHRGRKRRETIKRKNPKVTIKAESNIEHEAIRAEEAYDKAEAKKSVSGFTEVSSGNEDSEGEDLRDGDGFDGDAGVTGGSSPVSESDNVGDGLGGEADLQSWDGEDDTS